MGRQFGQFAKQTGGQFKIILFNRENDVVIETERERRDGAGCEPRKKFLELSFGNVQHIPCFTEDVAKAVRQAGAHALVEKANAFGAGRKRVKIFDWLKGGFGLDNGTHD